MLIAGACLAVSSTESMDDVQIHGFVSQGFIHSSEYNYLTPDSKDGSYEFAEYARRKPQSPGICFG